MPRVTTQNSSVVCVCVRARVGVVSRNDNRAGHATSNGSTRRSLTKSGASRTLQYSWCNRDPLYLLLRRHSNSHSSVGPSEETSRSSMTLPVLGEVNTGLKSCIMRVASHHVLQIGNIANPVSDDLLQPGGKLAVSTAAGVHENLAVEFSGDGGDDSLVARRTSGRDKCPCLGHVV